MQRVRSLHFFRRMVGTWVNVEKQTEYACPEVYKYHDLFAFYRQVMAANCSFVCYTCVHVLLDCGNVLLLIDNVVLRIS